MRVRVRVRVSNAFYASSRLLKAGNSGGLHSLTQFSVILCPYLPLWTLFKVLSCNLLVMQSSARGGGQAHQLCRSSSLGCSGRITSSFNRIPVFRHPSSFISKEVTNSLAQWEFISEVLPHEEPMCLVRE